MSREEGEYERFSTCAMNAYVQPVMTNYLNRVNDALSDAAVEAPLYVMKSNGGVTSARDAADHCVHTILSGPAGGVVAGDELGRRLGRPNVITADMGGTSFDVAMIHEGTIAFAKNAEIDGLALKAPMMDIHTIGAGGGSIAWIDSGGALRVGPQSAGAVPGPACYQAGGTEPTVTDANLVLGRLSTDSLLGGAITLDPAAAQRVIEEKIAARLGCTVEAAAEGIIRVINASMTAAIRKLTVERGTIRAFSPWCPSVARDRCTASSSPGNWGYATWSSRSLPGSPPPRAWCSPTCGRTGFRPTWNCWTGSAQRNSKRSWIT